MTATPTQEEESKEGATFEETKEIGNDIQGVSQGEASDSVAVERKTAEDKRASKLLSDISNTELFTYLMERVDKSEQIMDTISAFLQSEVPTTLPEADNEIQTESLLETQSETKEEIGINPEINTPAEAKPEEPVNETGDGLEKDMDTEGTVDPNGQEGVPGKSDDEPKENNEEDTPKLESPQGEKEKEEAPKEKEKDNEEDKKKKKPNFSASDVVSLVKENNDLKNKLAAQEQQLSELLSFKLKLDRQAKEKTLIQFALSDVAYNNIAKDFDTLTVEEVEAQGAIAFYKETKERGQKNKVNEIQFSLVTEDEEPDFNSNDEALLEVLERATKK